MIRKVQASDIPAITEIYNYYIEHSVATFDVLPYTLEEMGEKVRGIAGEYPYFVYEEAGKVVGFCYAHPWKEREAYRHTAESSVYVSPDFSQRNAGSSLMLRVISECRSLGFHALIACITKGNEASEHLHRKLGFEKVSEFQEVGFKFNRWLGIVDYELIL